VASVQELLRGPARSTLSNTESRFRLGDLVEALDHELRPSPIWSSGWRSTWRSTRTSLPRACSSPARLHQPLLEVPLCLLQPGRPQLAANVEPYLCADGTKVWSVMQFERQL
jgi:hypothetical protein